MFAKDDRCGQSRLAEDSEGKKSRWETNFRYCIYASDRWVFRPVDVLAMTDLFGNEIEETASKRKDWRGDSHSVFVTIGASNHAINERQKDDFYASHPDVGEWLMRLESFDGEIWEPCCGVGHLSKVFEKHGYSVKSTDLIDRGYGTGGIDFLHCGVDSYAGNIITNPPFSLAQEICQKAIDIVPEGKKVCMFLRTLFLEGGRRRTFFDSNPPRRVWVSSHRLNCARNGNFGQEGGAQSYSWFIWEKGYKDSTELKWFN